MKMLNSSTYISKNYMVLVHQNIGLVFVYVGSSEYGPVVNFRSDELNGMTIILIQGLALEVSRVGQIRPKW